MKIVIDIPDEDYKDIVDGYICQELADEMLNRVKAGTPLPKGHGDLVDEDKVILGLVYGKHIDKAKCGEITKIFDNAVVIPADKGE